MKRHLPFTLIALGCFALPGCVPKQTEHKIQADTKHQIEIKPIHITVDVNIKVDKQLDNFFDFQDADTKGS